MNSKEIFYDFEPILIDNVFTDQELFSIYDTRFRVAPECILPDGSQYVFADESCGYITCVYPLKESIRNKIENIIQDNVPIKVKSDGNHIPRYTLESGSKPQLRPHYDVGMKTASFTLSIQLDSTKSWDLYVKDKCFNLKKNQAVLFSGSHQIHWRPDIEFSENDYYDIIVCQAIEDSDDPIILDNEHKEKMQKDVNSFLEKYFI